MLFKRHAASIRRPFAGFPGMWRRHIEKSIFRQSPRLSTSGLLLRHGSPRRSAKNALLYVDLGRELPWSAAAFFGGGRKGLHFGAGSGIVPPLCHGLLRYDPFLNC